MPIPPPAAGKSESILDQVAYESFKELLPPRDEYHSGIHHQARACVYKVLELTPDARTDWDQLPLPFLFNLMLMPCFNQWVGTFADVLSLAVRQQPTN